MDKRDKRLRCAALIESASTRLLIDCGPDIRQQLMPLPFKPLDGILLTHSHYDHVGGIDDLRPFCVFGALNLYSDASTLNAVKRLMPYCFEDHLYPGVPLIRLHTVCPHETFAIGDIEITPIRVMHGRMPILGFRIGSFAYITDMKTIDDAEKEYLQGIGCLVVNALRFKKEHHSHQLVKDAVAFAREIKARHTFLIHVCHHIGLHSEAEKALPEDIRLAYDGMVINVADA